MKLLSILLGVVAMLQAAQPPRPADIRARLDAYESQTAHSGRADPSALAAIATDVIKAARRAPSFRDWSEACAVIRVADNESCESRLWTILNAAGPVGTRAEAASALIARGDTKAAETLFQLARQARVVNLAPLAPIIEELPPTRATAILARLAASPSESDQAVACKSLSRFSSPESRSAIAEVLDRNAPGSGPWLMCMIARGRLQDGVPPVAVGGYGRTLQGDGLLFAAQVMHEVDPDSATQLLADLSQRGPMTTRLSAAVLLQPTAPDVAIPVIEAAESDADPAVRAAALAAERNLRREPRKQVRRMLTDTAALVRIRAAEIALDWANR